MIKVGCPNIPLPKAINIHEGDISENFNFFKRSWENYLIASGLETQPEETKKSSTFDSNWRRCF